MNRQQRRNLASTLRKKGLSNEDVQTVIKLKEAQDTKQTLQPGDKVYLDIERIKQHPGWDDRRPEYKAFCESNVERTFTVECDGARKSNSGLVCLAEDQTVPKWLFWPGDLKKVSDE